MSFLINIYQKIYQVAPYCMCWLTKSNYNPFLFRNWKQGGKGRGEGMIQKELEPTALDQPQKEKYKQDLGALANCTLV